MLFRKLSEAVSHHPSHERLHLAVCLTFYLQQQTLLKRACADTSRVKLLQHLEYQLHLIRAYIYIPVYGKLVGNGIKVFSQ